MIKYELYSEIRIYETRIVSNHNKENYGEI